MSVGGKTPCDIVIFGGNGDLALRKLLPALYHLMRDEHLPSEGRIIGASRSKLTSEEYREMVGAKLKEYLPADDYDASDWASLCDRIHYVAVDANDITGYQNLKKFIDEEPGRDVVNYLSTSPSLFGSICNNLKEAGLVNEKTRIVLEKPIGKDLASSQVINDQVSKVFREAQIYRIDHYLGKETVQNLLALRFGNALFSPLWDKNGIDNVQITVAETVGVEGRWSYYDTSGAMRDMVQNHLLQLLCLVAMEPPNSLDACVVRDEKLKVLRSLHPIVGDEINTKTVRGQYAAGAINGKSVPGYTEEEGGNPTSFTETFVAIRADIDNWRWKGVPFYLRTGKRLPKRYSEIVIQFKEVDHKIFAPGSMQPNKLIIRLQPEEEIKLSIMNKVPGVSEGMDLREVKLNVSIPEAFENSRSPEAYERLLLDVVRGNPTLFMRRDEVEAAWTWADTILEGWEKANIAPKPYASGTWGPSSSIALTERDGFTWYE